MRCLQCSEIRVKCSFSEEKATIVSTRISAVNWKEGERGADVGKKAVESEGKVATEPATKNEGEEDKEEDVSNTVCPSSEMPQTRRVHPFPSFKSPRRVSEVVISRATISKSVHRAAVNNGENIPAPLTPMQLAALATITPEYSVAAVTSAAPFHVAEAELSAMEALAFVEDPSNTSISILEQENASMAVEVPALDSMFCQKQYGVS
jgi:hypothetical protein